MSEKFDLLKRLEPLFAKALRVFEREGKRDVGAWQRRIDARYELEIDGENISLYDEGKLVLRFVWESIIEIQSLQREEFPPLMWKIISRTGEYLLPSGGRYAEHLEKNFIYALPEYNLQQPVKATPPAGYKRATSLWRADDSFPRRCRADFEGIDL